MLGARVSEMMWSPGRVRVARGASLAGRKGALRAQVDLTGYTSAARRGRPETLSPSAQAAVFQRYRGWRPPTRGSEINAAPTGFRSMARPLGVSLFNPSWVRSAWW